MKDETARYEDLGNNILRIHTTAGLPDFEFISHPHQNAYSVAVGEHLQLRDGIRDRCGSFFDRCKNATFENMNMHYMHGLGIVAQRTDGFTMNNVVCAPDPKTGRIISCFADGCQIYKTSYGFVEDAIVRLCIEDDRYQEVKKYVADSLFKEKVDILTENGSKIDSASLMNKSLSQAVDKINNDPERYFFELQGDEVPTIRNKRVAKILAGKQIMKDPSWYDKIKAYAVINYINTDEALNIEIENINENNDLIRDMDMSIIDADKYNYLVDKVVGEIKANKSLMEEIKIKAEKKNKTFEQAIIDDAKWIANNRLNKIGVKVDKKK